MKILHSTDRFQSFQPKIHRRRAIFNSFGFSIGVFSCHRLEFVSWTCIVFYCSRLTVTQAINFSIKKMWPFSFFEKRTKCHFFCKCLPSSSSVASVSFFANRRLYRCWLPLRRQYLICCVSLINTIAEWIADDNDSGTQKHHLRSFVTESVWVCVYGCVC